jgi:hypothetical protein
MKRRALAGVLAAMLFVVGCEAPTRQYIAADSYGMYFAMPREWSPVPDRQMITAESGWTDDAGRVFSQTVLWQGAWTAGDANANEVFAARAPSQPVVFAYVRELIGVEQQGIASDTRTALQDIVLPASTILDSGGDVQTESWRCGGFSGLHQFATYATGGRMQTVEVVSMLPPGKDRVYVVVVRCSERCFTTNSGTINAIFDSLTFKEPRGQ